MFNEKPPSTSKWLVTVDDTLTSPVVYSGEAQTPDAVAGATPAIMSEPRLLRSRSLYADSFVLGLICQTIRAWKLLIFCGSTPRSVLDVGARLGSAVPGIPTRASAGSVLRWNARAEPKNHILSFLIGPPNEPSTFQSLSMPSGVFRPRALRSDVRLSDWKLWF